MLTCSALVSSYHQANLLSCSRDTGLSPRLLVSGSHLGNNCCMFLEFDGHQSNWILSILPWNEKSLTTSWAGFLAKEVSIFCAIIYQQCTLHSSLWKTCCLHVVQSAHVGECVACMHLYEGMPSFLSSEKFRGAPAPIAPMVPMCAICLQNPENAKQSYSIL